MFIRTLQCMFQKPTLARTDSSCPGWWSCHEGVRVQRNLESFPFRGKLERASSLLPNSIQFNHTSLTAIPFLAIHHLPFPSISSSRLSAHHRERDQDISSLRSQHPASSVATTTDPSHTRDAGIVPLAQYQPLPRTHMPPRCKR